jgi:hypothetical protein
MFASLMNKDDGPDGSFFQTRPNDFGHGVWISVLVLASTFSLAFEGQSYLVRLN